MHPHTLFTQSPSPMLYSHDPHPPYFIFGSQYSSTLPLNETIAQQPVWWLHHHYSASCSYQYLHTKQGTPTSVTASTLYRITKGQPTEVLTHTPKTTAQIKVRIPTNGTRRHSFAETMNSMWFGVFMRAFNARILRSRNLLLWSRDTLDKPN